MINYFNHTKSKIKKHTDSQMPGRWLILPDIFAGHHERMLQKQREDMRRKLRATSYQLFTERRMSMHQITSQSQSQFQANNPQHIQ